MLLFTRQLPQKTGSMKHHIARRVLGLTAFWVAVCAAPAAVAEPQAGQPDASDWEVLLSPYFWVSAVEGQITTDGATSDVDLSFGDVLDQTDFSYMGALEVRYQERWIFYLNFTGSRLEDESSEGPVEIGFGPRTIREGLLQIEIPRVATMVGPAEVDVTSTQYMVELFGGYRLLSRPLSELLGQPDPDDLRRLHVDVFGGVRFWHMKTEIEVEIPPTRIPGFSLSASIPAFPGLQIGDLKVPGSTIGGLDEEFEETDWWLDPVFGARITGDLCERLQLTLSGSVGGFGIGSSSRLTWSAMGALGYQLTDHWALVLGYRVLDVDRRNGNDAIDQRWHGPLLSATYRF